MLYVNVHKNDAEIRHQGDPIQIAVELSIVTGNIYNALKTENELGAELFRSAFIQCLSPDSPTWVPDKGQVVIKVPAQKMAVPPPVKVRAPQVEYS